MYFTVCRSLFFLNNPKIVGLIMLGFPICQWKSETEKRNLVLILGGDSLLNSS